MNALQRELESAAEGFNADGECWPGTLLATAAKEIERLRVERDEARAEVERCRSDDAFVIGHNAGWDDALDSPRVKEIVRQWKALRKALSWYGEQARLARLIHQEGDAGRHALAEDGGQRARAVLALKS